MVSQDVMRFLFKQMGCTKPEYADILFEKLEDYSAKGLNTQKRLAHFIAQCSHESVGFKYLEENLNYTTVSRLQSIFGKTRFPDEASTQPYVRNPRALANKVYNGRMGNVIGTDDGWDFRGAGIIHLTGRDNFTKYSKLLDKRYDLSPELAREIGEAFDIALAYFLNATYKGQNVFFYADLGDIRRVSRIINGGTNGMQDRVNRTTKLLGILDLQVNKVNTVVKTTSYKLLVVGSRGASVKLLQQALTDKGFSTNGVDGIYGNDTYKAVIAFQKKNKLVVDGKAGQSVQGQLYN